VSGRIEKVAFVGLGQMGWPMAANLAKAGLTLRVVDRNPEAVAGFVAANGGSAHATPAEAAEGADLAITIVPTSKIAEEVIVGVGGIASATHAPSLVVEMTSGQPQHTRAIGQRLASRSIRMIDAPVSGGVVRAKSGELTIMLGGQAAACDEAMPVLRHMGKAITRVGDLGSGQALKALNNLCSAAGLLIAGEVVAVAQRFGLDPQTVVDVLNDSSGMNHALKTKFKPFVLSGTYGSGFSLDLMVKDLGIALELAQDLQAQTPFAQACLERWRHAGMELGPGRDHTEITRVSASLAGLQSQENRP
jgi:3-hydroxyisobutyrate dehydrogenase